MAVPACLPIIGKFMIVFLLKSKISPNLQFFYVFKAYVICEFRVCFAQQKMAQSSYYSDLAIRRLWLKYKSRGYCERASALLMVRRTFAAQSLGWVDIKKCPASLTSHICAFGR